MTRVLITLHLVAPAAFAAGPPLQDFGSPFDGKNCDVSWEAQNNLPRSVRIFAVVPREFSAATVSNALQIAELQFSQRKRVDQSGVFADKDVQFFGDRKGTRHVTLVPSQGFLVISKDGALAAPRQTPVGVPDEKEAVLLASALLTKLGFDLSELVTGFDGRILPSNFSEGTVFHKAKPTGHIVTNVVSRGVSFTRKIDGIPVSGMADISMKFGNEGKLSYLVVTRRSMTPKEDCPVPSAAEFIGLIKSNKTLISQGHEAKRFKKLTIKKVQLYYWESEGSKRQTMIYPFASLEAKTDLAPEPSEVRLFVPFAD